MTELELRCKHCGRFIPLQPVKTTITRYRCTDRKCKKWNNIKVVFSDATEEQLRYTFPKETKQNPV